MFGSSELKCRFKVISPSNLLLSFDCFVPIAAQHFPIKKKLWENVFGRNICLETETFGDQNRSRFKMITQASKTKDGGVHLHKFK